MKLLALDISTKTGWAIFENGAYKTSGALDKVFIEDFNVNKEPQKSSAYPWNIIDAADQVSRSILALYNEHLPDVLVLEDTNKGRNRATQRALEWIHSAVLKILRPNGKSIKYMDSSDWRKTVGLKLNPDQKKNNKEVSAGKKRGKINKKHLSVLMTNEKFGLQLKLKDNDQSDACLLGLAYCIKNQ
jgi:hypothetical protein